MSFNASSAGAGSGRQPAHGDGAQASGLGQRQVQRLVCKVREEGAMAVRHKRRGRPLNNRISDLKRDYILSLIRSDYPDLGPTLATEKLDERHGIRVSSKSLAIDAGGRALAKPRPAASGASAAAAARSLGRVDPDRRLRASLVRKARPGLHAAGVH